MWQVRYKDKQAGLSFAEMDEAALIRRAPGEGEAFAELYRRYITRVFHYHLARMGSEAEAEDLTSQTFLAALEGIRSYRRSGSFSAWLFGIAHHKLVDHYRKQRPVIAFDSAESLIDNVPPAEETAATRLRLAAVGSALMRLTPEQRDAVLLRLYGQLSAAEAGEVMGKSEDAVKMLVFRALHRMREELAITAEVGL